MTKKDTIAIRFGEEKDISLILEFIKKLAIYEKLEHEVTATEEILRESIFIRKGAEVIIGEFNGQPVGFALFFHNFSTFMGKPGIYIEDLFIDKAFRGNGFGKAMLAHIAALGRGRDCGRVEWWVLDWNEPSIQFYKGLKAIPMDEWTVFRLTGDALEALAELSS